MNWHIIWSRSIAYLLAIVFSLSVITPVFANAPAPPFLYWLKFDPASDLQGIQIGQCRDNNCQQSVLLKQYGKCDLQGCLPAPAKFTLPKPLGLECAENLCAIARSPFYDRRELDPSKIQIRAQINDRVFASKIFPLSEGSDRIAKFQVTVINSILKLSPDANLRIERSTLWHSLFQVAFVMTIAIESAIWAGYLRWRKRSTEIWATIGSLVLVEIFSLPIIWLFVPSIQHFASDSERYSGWIWLMFAIGYGMIIFLYSRRQKPMRWSIISIGSIAYWLGSVFVTFLLSALFSYGSPTPSAVGISPLLALVVGELIVISYEAWIIQRLSGDRLDFKTALSVSASANIASCLVGLAVDRLPLT